MVSRLLKMSIKKSEVSEKRAVGLFVRPDADLCDRREKW
jgi:hypothetical protein